MQTQKTIIEQYLAADDEQRLAMFLSHRDYRRQFVKIDMTGLKAGRVQTAARQEAPHRSRHAHLHNACWGWLKRCWSVR